MKRENVIIPLLIAMFMVFFGFSAGLSEKKAEGEKHPEVDFSVSCVDCHAEVTPDIVAAWKKSKHGVMNYGCYMCHGDGQVEFWAKPGTQTCQSCHSGLHTDYSKTVAKSCFDCHDGHTLKFHE